MKNLRHLTAWKIGNIVSLQQASGKDAEDVLMQALNKKRNQWMQNGYTGIQVMSDAEFKAAQTVSGARPANL
jgi:hypothetical protein